jgi:hypothetical protein
LNANHTPEPFEIYNIAFVVPLTDIRIVPNATVSVGGLSVVNVTEFRPAGPVGPVVPVLPV